MESDLPEAIAKLTCPVILCLFTKAGDLVSSHRVDGSLPIGKKLFVAAEAARKKCSEKFQLESECYLHLLIVTSTADFSNFGIRGLFDNKIYEPHVTGLTYSLGDKHAELNPIQSLARNFGSKMARTHLAGLIGFAPKEIVLKTDLRIGVYRALHFGESYPDREPCQFHRGHSIVSADDVCLDTIRKSLRLVGQWYKNNVDDNGEVTYEYFPSTARYKSENRTIVRSTMAVWVLNKLSRFLDDANLRVLGKRGLDYYLQRFYCIEQSLLRGKIVPSNVPTKKGELPVNRFTSASFLILAILESGDLGSYQQEVDLLWSWVSQYQRKDGYIWTQFAQSQYFDTGQLMLAAAALFEHTGEAHYAEFFNLSARYYSRQVLQMLELGNGLYTPYAPAWFTQPFARMHSLTGDKLLQQVVFSVNDRVCNWYRLNTEHKAYWDYDGILVPKGWTYGNVSITAASLESLVDAARVAQAVGDSERFSKLMKVIPRTVAYLLRLQFTPANTYYARHRERVIGGFKTDLVNSRVWCDNVWHLTGAFMKIVESRLLDKISL